MQTNIAQIESIVLAGEKFENIDFEYFYHKNDFECKTLFILHALTGDASIFDYWSNFVGPNKVFDTNKFNIVCITTLGTTKGSFGPNSIYKGKKLGEDFPKVNINDFANFQVQALKQLGITSVDVLIGTSLGGIVGWNIVNNYTDFAKKVMLIGSLDKIGVELYVQNNIALDILSLDQSPQKEKSLALCRKLGMIQYQTFAKNNNRFNAAQYQSYMEYQGQKFVNRFDYISYSRLLSALNSTVEDNYLSNWKLNKQTPIAILAIVEDTTFFIEEERELYNQLTKKGYDNVTYCEVNDISGHDAFLISDEKFKDTINNFIGE